MCYSQQLTERSFTFLFSFSYLYYNDVVTHFLHLLLFLCASLRYETRLVAFLHNYAHKLVSNRFFVPFGECQEQFLLSSGIDSGFSGKETWVK